MKKVLIFLAVIIVIFASIILLNNYSNKAVLGENNPYGTDDLHPETIKLLKDSNYQNVILPDELAKSLNNGEDKTIYFFSPLCSFCKQTTPIVVPLAEELGVNLELYNMLEFEQGWNDYNIKGTPTIIHFKDGQEVARISSLQDKEVFEHWFNDYVIQN